MEVQGAMRLGLDMVKFFPAGPMGGARTVAALAAPFASMRFVPTGGVSPGNLAEYLSLPSVIAVGGSWMVATDLVRAGDWTAIATATREAVTLATDPAMRARTSSDKRSQA